MPGRVEGSNEHTPCISVDFHIFLCTAIVVALVLLFLLVLLVLLCCICLLIRRRDTGIYVV